MFDKTKILAGFSATAVTLFLGLGAPDAEAAFISMDSSFGVNTITRDTDTGLEWLDLTESTGLSVNQVQAELGAGGLYEGFSYATRSDVETLFFTSAGITPGFQWPPELPVWELANLLGITEPFFFVSFGHYLLEGPALNAGLGSLEPLIPFGDAAATRATLDDNGFAFNEAAPTVGSFLIRSVTASPTPVPEPGTALLLLSSLAALGYAKRRRQGAKTQRRSTVA